MFTKMCIADNLAVITDAVWNDYSSQGGSTLFLVAMLYLIQMYADFDGYSNMAIGVGKILGFRVAPNFNHPLLARNIADYWRRWHMSLTSWITDYVLTPLNLAFRNFGKSGLVIAVMVNLIVIGFWHGANWTYGLFGFYHGLLIVPLVFSGSFGKSKKIKPTRYGLPGINDLLKMIGTFCLVSIGLIIFRAPSVSDAFSYISGIFSMSFFSLPSKTISAIGNITFLFILLLIVLEWITREQEYPIQNLGLKWSRPIRFAMYYVIIFAIIYFGGKEQQFIYFQF
jgi:D-alanyl-lipoteichoic acid acyltransferase DltB (MBOAT superfamily)